MQGLIPPSLASIFGLGKIRLASRESGPERAGCLESGMGPPRRLDFLIGRIDGRELVRGDPDGLGRHAAGHHHVGMVLGDEPMILALKLGVGRLGRGLEDVVGVVQTAPEMPAL